MKNMREKKGTEEDEQKEVREEEKKDNKVKKIN